MKITEEQAKKFEEGCGNNFNFDFNRYLNWGEKQLSKYLDIENNTKLKAKIEYLSEGKNQVPTLSLSIWKGSENNPDILRSSCKTQYISLGEPQKTRNFRLLKEYSHKITDDYILKVHDKKITSKDNILFGNE